MTHHKGGNLIRVGTGTGRLPMLVNPDNILCIGRPAAKRICTVVGDDGVYELSAAVSFRSRRGRRHIFRLEKAIISVTPPAPSEILKAIGTMLHLETFGAWTIFQKGDGENVMVPVDCIIGADEGRPAVDGSPTVRLGFGDGIRLDVLKPDGWTAPRPAAADVPPPPTEEEKRKRALISCGIERIEKLGTTQGGEMQARVSIGFSGDGRHMLTVRKTIIGHRRDLLRNSPAMRRLLLNTITELGLDRFGDWQVFQRDSAPAAFRRDAVACIEITRNIYASYRTAEADVYLTDGRALCVANEEGDVPRLGDEELTSGTLAHLGY